MKSISAHLSLIESQKEQLDALRPFPVDQLRNLRERFRIWFIHHTNAYEGNTLTLTEVKVLLEDGITVGGKTVREMRETLNQDQLMTLFGDFLERTERCSFSETQILHMHQILMHDILSPENVWAWRTINVSVSGSDDSFPEPEEVPNRMKQFFASAVCSPRSLEDIAMVHWEFVKIHPFVGGNGRIARLLLNMGLVQLWYMPIIISTPVRGEYIDSLKGDDPEKFIQFFVRQVHENHKDYCRFFGVK